MTTMILIEAKIKEGSVPDAIAFLEQRFPETRDYEGCQGITAYLNDDTTTMVFVEHWDSQNNFDQYLAWRQETGSFAAFTGMIERDLEIRSFEQVDA